MDVQVSDAKVSGTTCPNGHDVRREASLCTVCGTAVSSSGVASVETTTGAPPKSPNKSPRALTRFGSKHPWVMGIVALLIGAGIGSAGSGASKGTSVGSTAPAPAVTVTVTATAQAAPPVQATTTPKPAHVRRWVTVATLRGTGPKRSGIFSLTGGPAHLSYTIRGDSNYATASIYVVAAGDSLDKSGGFPEVDSGPGSDSTVLVQDPGRYYLDVNSANASWSIVVQEYR
jgi:hypothetical protein